MPKITRYWAAVFFLWSWGSTLAAAYGDELITIDAALKQVFPGASFSEQRITLTRQQIADIEHKASVTLSEENRTGFTLYTARDGGGVTGYAFPDTVHGKWGPISYLTAMTPAGNVREVVILAYQEVRGRPVAKKRFLKQYAGKSTGDAIELQRDIQGITGATISSRSVTDGVRKLLHVFSLIQH